MSDSGNLYIIAAPSGTGKTTLVKAVVDTVSKIMVSISYTTRPKRLNEMHGINYHFISKDEFETMIKHGDFLEYAMIFDHYYGTSKSWVEQKLASGSDIILEIDWQGHQQIKKLFPNSIGIFILPPSLNDLRERLTKRNQDCQTIIKRRLADVKETVSHAHEFEFIVINDDFDHALHDLKMIIETNRLSQSRQSLRYEKLIKDLSLIA